jgi:tRNA threonylcarbamoyl adenosine modification protein (Sua5/YciO/YrdC/YwlC family)
MLASTLPRSRMIPGPKVNMFSSQSVRARLLPATGQRVTEAVEALRREKIIAIPTDTLYGLAASACSQRSIERLYAAKQRSSDVPLAICVSEAEDVRKYAEADHLSADLLEELLPGPITILLRRKSNCELSTSLNPGVPLLGIRVPNSDFVRAISRQYGHAIALTSANQSGTPSTLSVHEFSSLWDECALVFDGGSIVSSRLGSTIVNLSVPGEFSIVRRGDACEDIQDILNKHGVSSRR